MYVLICLFIFTFAFISKYTYVCIDITPKRLSTSILLCFDHGWYDRRGSPAARRTSDGPPPGSAAEADAGFQGPSGPKDHKGTVLKGARAP